MDSKTMTIDQALGVVSQVCADFHGTLNDHRTIQQALQVIEQGLQRDEQPVAEPPAAAPAAAKQK